MASIPRTARAVLEYLRTNGPATTADMIAILGLPRGSVINACQKMREQGAVEGEIRHHHRGYLWSYTGHWPERDANDLAALIDAHGRDGVLAMVERLYVPPQPREAADAAQQEQDRCPDECRLR